MKEFETISPLIDELSAHYADRLGVAYSSKVTKEHKKETIRLPGPAKTS